MCEFELQSRLQHAIEVEQVYLDPELNLQTLSRHLMVSPKQLSAYINKKYHQGFFTFVNSLRIHSFKQFCVDPQTAHYYIIEKDFDSGFNSKASFYRAFRKFESQNPSNWIKSIVLNNNIN